MDRTSVAEETFHADDRPACKFRASHPSARAYAPDVIGIRQSGPEAPVDHLALYTLPNQVEVNGLYTYRREPKLDPHLIRAIDVQLAGIERALAGVWRG